MRLVEFYIGNYRSLSKQTLQCNNINALVGPNNAGKTNILSAIKLFFTTKAQTDLNDAHAKIQSSTILLRAIIQISGKLDKRDMAKYNLLFLVNNDLMTIERKHKTNEAAKYYYIQGKNRTLLKQNQLYYLQGLFRKHFIFIDLANDEHIDYNNLESIVGYVIKNKFSDYQEKQINDKTEAALKNLNAKIDGLYGPIKQRFLDNFSLSKKDISFKLDIDAKKLISFVKLYINQGDPVHHLQSKGHGIKNIAAYIFLGLFKYHSPSIIVIEEPESHLHPSYLRPFIQSLLSLSTQKQIILTTHSCNVVDVIEPMNIYRVFQENGYTKISKPKITKKDVYDFYKYIYNKNAECLFAKRVIIVEGISDSRILSNLSNKIISKVNKNKINLSFDQNDIQVIEVTGGNFHGPISLLDAFNIGWMIVGDDDKWPKDFMRTIDALKLNKKHPIKYKYLTKMQLASIPINNDIRKVLYEHFKIISVPTDIEKLILNKANAPIIKSILKKYLPDRYKEKKKGGGGNNDLKLCYEIMKKHKPEWSIILSKELPTISISQGIIELIKLIVLKPAHGCIDQNLTEE
ncbi:MAG: hypothetical protein A2509_11620 [Candidatus Edwardsbacteria bacterium RIFOXYD12_FULL_50_11]|uniref:Uncharacterized protein n=1 Tax=Candidatus Edwardsbacteria bacterium GWF2_54_11 TaxID=1817851 RepID=A0A1F5R2D9_9BACT|nr:MAG: hypothetical protein A2502_04430 [Candidatus Edwardsbacteria bacterium RifOxyC12_full_54_24]OGF08081.1 MAG: hypothetical protein A2024_04965 [Candidatus Edwardsbacteria bacterium GWF2_54_11]OGF08642.1 MAG: hypothetical protein A2273_06810 [Candidatus Edwardsbacteria bacterium RifOxyA12_full_54_48]OGF11286.1 MAG: hypothetical protein A3K15_02875 [Candidatus Edwardsbacteria bacterium GWE2_54_12]OGF16772.1 MAG: hypothetical protein A2509_11620 [Candidatus Edwardsbacteria bacterium RIFOXYD1